MIYVVPVNISHRSRLALPHRDPTPLYVQLAAELALSPGHQEHKFPVRGRHHERETGAA